VSLVIDGRPILQDVSLRVPAGATYAIVGPLGSGKSSLVSLIPRLQDVTSGQVLVDGIDVRELPLEDLRRQIGFVPQETFLFSGSIRDNVAFGLSPDEATESRVRGAVRLSRLENDLDQWPGGLETLIGERGVTLSGGQKQRTAIARAVAKEPRMLILDDALSSVDTRTEEAVLEGLHAFMARRTSLVIAHRLSTTRSAERVIVLDKGRIVEEGTHAELVQQGGLYTRMYRRQLIAQELELDEEEEAEEEEDGAVV
jgi:ATP-binding cassette subfamily B protein